MLLSKKILMYTNENTINVRVKKGCRQGGVSPLICNIFNDLICNENERGYKALLIVTKRRLSRIVLNSMKRTLNITEEWGIERTCL